MTLINEDVHTIGRFGGMLDGPRGSVLWQDWDGTRGSGFGSTTTPVAREPLLASPKVIQTYIDDDTTVRPRQDVPEGMKYR